VQFGLIFCGPVVINAVVEEHLRYVITIYHTAYLLIAPDVSPICYRLVSSILGTRCLPKRHAGTSVKLAQHSNRISESICLPQCTRIVTSGTARTAHQKDEYVQGLHETGLGYLQVHYKFPVNSR